MACFFKLAFPILKLLVALSCFAYPFPPEPILRSEDANKPVVRPTIRRRKFQEDKMRGKKTLRWAVKQMREGKCLEELFQSTISKADRPYIVISTAYRTANSVHTVASFNDK